MKLKFNVYDQKQFLKNAAHQKFVWVEELSELQKEITKYARGKGVHDHLVEEFADVVICLGQICEYLGLTRSEIQAMIDKKYARNCKRLKARERRYNPAKDYEKIWWEVIRKKDNDSLV